MDENTIGKLYIVATPIGNSRDMSPRGKQILSDEQLNWLEGELADAESNTQALIDLIERDITEIVIPDSVVSTSDFGYLFYGCTVTSAIPEVEMATATYAKPGYFGRPWDTKGEAIFVNTIVEETKDPNYSGSMIIPAGWNSGLSGESPNCMEFGTQELSGVDNLASRVTWAKVLPNTGVKPCATCCAHSIS